MLEWCHLRLQMRYIRIGLHARHWSLRGFAGFTLFFGVNYEDAQSFGGILITYAVTDKLNSMSCVGCLVSCE